MVAAKKFSGFLGHGNAKLPFWARSAKSCPDKNCTPWEKSASGLKGHFTLKRVGLLGG
jgi:hypothetical protein